MDIYGLSEIMGPGVACECECQDGLHGWEDHFLFEVIDPESGRALPEGEAGELVITTLTKQALPMLRYRTRDITRLTTAPCDCGRTHVRILRITGRNDDMLIIRGVNVYPSQIEAVLVGRPNLAPHYQLVVERHGILDHVRVEVEAAPGVDADLFDAIARDVKHHIKSQVGITTEVSVQPTGTIPRSQGKAVRVRDLRPKEVLNDAKQILSLNVNGRTHEVAAPGSALLLEVLRDQLGLTGTKQGCDGGECGACTVLVDDEPRLACITLAASVVGQAHRNHRGAVRVRPHEPAAAGVPRKARHAVRLLHARAW